MLSVEISRFSGDEYDNFEYDTEENLLSYFSSTDWTMTTIIERRNFEYDSDGSIVYLSYSVYDTDWATEIDSVEMHINYDEQGNLVRIRKETYSDGSEHGSTATYLFHSNGEVASYFGAYSYFYFAEARMSQCTYDTSGNLLTSVGGFVDYYAQESWEITPSCGVSIPDPTSYWVYPTPLTDDGTSHTPVTLTCTP